MVKADDIRIYDYTLSQEEVLSLAQLSWMYLPLDSVANLYDDEIIDHRDYAVIASEWLRSYP